MRVLYICVIAGLFLPWQVLASESPERVYQQSLHLAVQGKLSESIIALQAASAVLPNENIWRERMLAASVLLDMKQQQAVLALASEHNKHLQLAAAYIQTHSEPEPTKIWPVAALATVFPGAGHAWLGRWHDALVAGLFVWPFLLLTLWARHRRMGPVTVFFAGLTLWLWSGAIFSAISLAERGSLFLYMQWWQSVWQASGLPGQAW